MKKEYHCDNPDQLTGIAEEILAAFPENRIFALFGAMGSGKTTFVKSLCERLGIIETVSSPTFSIVNEYVSRDGDRVFHFDFYRIKKIEEAYDLGYEDYFFSGNYCFIEWPEKIEELLPENSVYIKIDEIGDLGKRRFLAENK